MFPPCSSVPLPPQEEAIRYPFHPICCLRALIAFVGTQGTTWSPSKIITRVDSRRNLISAQIFGYLLNLALCGVLAVQVCESSALVPRPFYQYIYQHSRHISCGLSQRPTIYQMSSLRRFCFGTHPVNPDNARRLHHLCCTFWKI